MAPEINSAIVPQNGEKITHPGARVFVSIACDGIVQAVLPTVNRPTAGGLTYEDLIRIFRGMAAKAEHSGTAIIGDVPALNNGYLLSTLVAARMTPVAMVCGVGALPANL